MPFTLYKGQVMKKKLLSSKSGFTLVELVVTISIFSILAAIAIPGFSKWLPSYNLKSAARDVFSNMQLSKLDAIKNNTNCIVTFDTVAKSYTLAFSGGSRTVNLPDYDRNVQFKGPTDSSITFTPRGMILNPSARQVTITNTQNTATWQITIETFGTISLKKL
jgi:prepilin-type N-terminal cleavage/methylation domain-containing protein